MDSRGRDPYPGEDEPSPQPCPECSHIDWLEDVLFNPRNSDPIAFQSSYECGNCGFTTTDLEVAFR